MDKKIIIFLLALVVLAGGLWFWSEQSGIQNQPATPITSDVVLFYGKECPHCKEVEKFLEDNKISEKVKYDYLEVWHNKENSKILVQKAQECGIPEDQLGVPFLYAKGKCFMGTPQIEAYFKKEAGIE